MNHSRFKLGLGAAICAAWMAAAPLAAPIRAQDPQTAPDNTKANKTDTKGGETGNADRAKNNVSDRKIMAQIRRDIVHDKSLSTYGHNVKVVASQGKVTLKGPVHSDDEKKTIEQYAAKYAGDGNVDDQLTVKSEQK
jgi:hyperosmotically inducible periplasmic protein